MSHFFAFISRMKFINRWALMRNTREENLYEHSYDVAIIAHALCVIGNNKLGKNHDAGKCVLTALYHDSSEIITGDMPTPVKYYNKSIVSAYKELEQNAAMRIAQKLPDYMQKDYEPLLCCNDDDVKAIVKAADKISAYLKCVEELKMGNNEFAAAKQANYKQIQALCCEEAEIFLKEFAKSYALPLDEIS